MKGAARSRPLSLAGEASPKASGSALDMSRKLTKVRQGKGKHREGRLGCGRDFVRGFL